MLCLLSLTDLDMPPSAILTITYKDLSLKEIKCLRQLRENSEARHFLDVHAAFGS